MAKVQDNKILDDEIYSLLDDYETPFGLPMDTLEDYEDADIRQRIEDSKNDDTHPSTDADLDPQEMYDLGYIW